MSNGRIEYKYEKEQFGTQEPQYRVTRWNKIGQGWGITAYTDEFIARVVTDLLNIYAEFEGN